MAKFKAGSVAIVGRPNVGKSTLLNAILGQKIAITSSRVQTTRFRIRGVLSGPQGQIVFVDTPGFSKALDKLGEFITQEAFDGLKQAEAVVFVVDGSVPCGRGDSWLAEALQKTGLYVLLLINKIDSVQSAQRDLHKAQYCKLFETYKTWDFLTVSAKTGKRLSEVSKTLLRHLPEGTPLYDEDTVTDLNMRAIAQEMIREKVMTLTEDELPHSIAVWIEQFDESDPACIKIEAILYVDQTSQKGMVIGKQGQMIKQIGQAARKDIEEMVEAQVFLNLQVKVKQNWRRDAEFLAMVGLS
jgi:GTPase